MDLLVIRISWEKQSLNKSMPNWLNLRKLQTLMTPLRLCNCSTLTFHHLWLQSNRHLKIRSVWAITKDYYFAQMVNAKSMQLFAHKGSVPAKKNINVVWLHKSMVFWRSIKPKNNSNRNLLMRLTKLSMVLLTSCLGSETKLLNKQRGFSSAKKMSISWEWFRPKILQT